MPPAVAFSELIALLGGRFDPPHVGHIEAARGLFKNPGVRKLWILPSPTPPHKRAVAPFEDRLKMAEIAFLNAHPEKDRDAIRIDTREADRARLRPDLPTYSFDTIAEIRRETRKIAFVIGADQLEHLPSWHRFPEILGLCHWIILGRRPDGIARAQAALSEWEGSGLARKSSEPLTWILGSGETSQTHLKLVPTDAPEVSSTWIREHISRTGEPPQDSLAEGVLAYLKQARLYGIKSHPIKQS